MQIHNAEIYFPFLRLHGMASWLPSNRAQFIRALSSAQCAPAHTQRTTKKLNAIIQERAPPQVLNEKLFWFSKLVLISMNELFVLADLVSMSSTVTLLKSLKMPKDHPRSIHNSYYPLRKKETCCCYPFAKERRWVCHVVESARLVVSSIVPPHSTW